MFETCNLCFLNTCLSCLSTVADIIVVGYNFYEPIWVVLYCLCCQKPRNFWLWASYCMGSWILKIYGWYDFFSVHINIKKETLDEKWSQCSWSIWVSIDPLSGAASLMMAAVLLLRRVNFLYYHTFTSKRSNNKSISYPMLWKLIMSGTVVSFHS